MKRRDQLRKRMRIASVFMLSIGLLLLVLPALGTGDETSSEPVSSREVSSSPAGAVEGEGSRDIDSAESFLADDQSALEAETIETGDVPPRTGGPRILRANLDGPVSPGSASYLIDAVSKGSSEGYDAVLVVMDTPGGLLESTRDISRAFLESEAPVIVFIHPTGARAASAGMFITMSAHVAVMAPGTRIGAAAPVALGGGDGEDGTMDMKVIEDTAAFARSVAEQTGRNGDWAEKAVREAVSATASEALELGAIDVIATNVADLLEKIDGRQVRLHDGREIELRAKDAEIEDHKMTIQQQVLMVLGNPNVAYILLMLGLLGLMMELYNPGLIFPAAIGLFLLLLAGIGLNLLPVNTGGVILIIIAIGLIVAEIYVTAYGILALLGVGIMILGSALLMDTTDPDYFVDPGFSVSWGVILPTVILIAAVSIGLMLYILQVHRRRAPTGFEGMEGEIGKARTEIGPDGGRAFVHGEIWQAVSDEPVPVGETVVVVGVQGLLLKVERQNE